MTATDSDAPAPRPPWRATPSGTTTGLRVLSFLLRLVPLRLGYVLVLPLVLMWFIHYNRPRIALTRAMVRMGARFPLWAALQAYLQYAFTLVDRSYVQAGRVQARVDPAGSDDWRLIEETVARPGPLVLLGGHAGTLEVGAAGLEGLGRVVRAVAVRDPGAGALLEGVGDAARDLGSQAETILADRSVASGLRMLRALREGEILCLKGDRVLPGSGPDDVVLVDFFGEEAAFPVGPLKIARAARAAVVVATIVRTGPARYQVLARVLEPDTDVERLTRAYAAAYEEQVALRPDQWFNFFPFWPSDAVAVEAQPEVVPLGARAAEHGLWGGVASSSAFFLLEGLFGPPIAWGPAAGTALAVRVSSAVGAVSWGLVAGLVTLAIFVPLGASKEEDGRRNLTAQLLGVAAPAFATVLPLVLAGGAAREASTLVTTALCAAFGGWLLGWVGPQARRASVGVIGLALLLAVLVV